jgi:hypothetical protein
LGNNLILKNIRTNTLKPSNIQMWAAYLLVVMLISLFGTVINSVSADAGMTTQTTGASGNDLIGPTQFKGQPGDWGPPILATVSVTGTSVNDLIGPTQIQDQPDSNGGGLNKAYTRFEIHQVSKMDLVGTFEVVGDGFNSVTPYSAASGDELSVYIIFPESTGRYQLWLKADGYDEPVLWVEGELERISEGKYRHQLIGGKANPDVFELTPDEPGMMIALGSVKAKLNSCVQFFSPINAVFDLGVDADGDGLIAPLESVTEQINGQSQTCIGTPELNIPLTSHYRSQVTTQDGTVIARNEGLYDFLNKSTVNSEKEAHAEFVKEFKLQWIRTPVATSIKVMNSALRAPADHVEVVPQVEEVTGDIIRNGSDSDTTTVIPGDGSPPSNTDGTGTSQSGGSSETGIPSEPESSVIDNNPLKFILENWMLLALGAGLAFAASLIIRGVTSTRSLSYQNA